MATRKKNTHSRSAFHKHVKFSIHDPSNICDFTEYKLNRLLLVIKDEKQRQFIERLLSDYLLGLVAIAWEDGVVPFYAPVKKNKL